MIVKEVAQSDLPAAKSDDGYQARFGIGQAGTSLLREGWFEAEKEFVWSNGKFASIEIPHGTLEGDKYILSITAWGYVPPEADPQEVLIFANGRLIGMQRLSVRSVMNFEFTGDGDDWIKLALYIPTARSPKQCEGSADSRQLGIALVAVAVASSPQS